MKGGRKERENKGEEGLGGKKVFEECGNEL